MKRVMKRNGIFVPYYNDVLFSDIILKAGMTVIKFFARAEDAANRNYNHETNPFPNGEGNVISLGANLFGQSYGSIEITPSTTAILNAIAKIRNAGALEMEIGGDIVHRDALTSLLPPMPIVLKPENQGTPDNVVRPAIALMSSEDQQSQWMNGSKQLIVPFKGGLPVKTGESLSVTLTFKGGIAVPAEIENFILRMKFGVQALTSGGVAVKQ